MPTTGAPCMHLHFSFTQCFIWLRFPPKSQNRTLLGSETSPLKGFFHWNMNPCSFAAETSTLFLFHFFLCVVSFVELYTWFPSAPFWDVLFSCSQLSPAFTPCRHPRAHTHTRKRMQYGTNVCKTMEASPSFIRHKYSTLRLSSSQDTTRGIKKKGRKVEEHCS